MSVQPGAEQKDQNQNQNPPPDEAAKKAAAAAAGDGADDSVQEPDESLIPDALKPYVQKLRKEAGKYRTKAKNLEGEIAGNRETLTKYQKAMAIIGGQDEGEKVDPEAQIQSLQDSYQGLEMEHAILQSAYSNGIPQEQVKYYRFLLSEKLQAMEDGEELSEDDMAEITAEVKKAGGVKAQGSTGVSANGNAPAPQSGKGSVTVEQFKRMSTTEKSSLYAKDSAMYQRLADEARLVK
jgi:type I site-specific restriction-modification system R (restriction) subunit